MSQTAHEFVAKAARQASTVTDRRPRCSQCRRLLAELITRPWAIRCSRCKHLNVKEGPIQPPA